MLAFDSCKVTDIEPYEDYHSDNPMVHQQGTSIVNGDGAVLNLIGTIPLGWIQWGGALWNCGLTSEKKIASKLTQLVGEARFNQFRDSVYANFVAEADIAQMAAMGFNCIRVPFNHSLLEDDADPYFYKQSGWDLLDRVIDQCEAHGIYVVLDLHSAPGGQSGLFISDPDDRKLWQEDENQNRTIELWRAIALRYKDREIVAGYDLLNEPDFPDINKLICLYQNIISSVREVDPYHMFFIEGNKYAVEFKSFDRPFSRNMAWSFHSYDLLGINAQIGNFQKAVEAGQKHQVPIWNGEFGADDISWTENTVAMFNNSTFPVSGWIFWPWKKVPIENEVNYRHLVYFNPGANWDKVSRFIEGSGTQPTAIEAEAGLVEFVEACRFSNCQVDQEMLNVLR